MLVAALPATAQAAVGSSPMLLESDLYLEGGFVKASVESPCGGQVVLDLYRDGTRVRTISGSEGTVTSFPCNGTAPTRWGLNTGLTINANCG
jgi:hypothetical protein